MSQNQAIDVLIQLLNSSLKPEVKLSALEHPEKRDIDTTLLNRIENQPPSSYDELCAIVGISEQTIETMLEALTLNCVIDANGAPSSQFIFNLTGDAFQPGQNSPTYREAEALDENWVHDELELIFEIEPYNNGYIALPRKQGQEIYGEPLIFETSLAPDIWDALPGSELPAEFTPDIYDAIVDAEEKKSIDRIRLRKLSDEHIEIATAEFKWIFCGAGNGPNPLDTPDDTLSAEEKQLLDDRAKELAKEALVEKKREGAEADGSLDGLPDWWDEKDTKELLRRLGEELKKKVNPKEIAKEKLAEKAIEKAAARVLAEMLTSRERTIAYRRLVAKGVNPQKAARIADRLAKRLYQQYLFKHPTLLKRFSVFTKFNRLKLLLKSPKIWARSALAKALIKGLGAKVLGVLGLISDLYTIGEALYLWYQASKAWEAARESHRQADELERRFRKMLEEMTPEQRKQYEEREKKRREFYKRLQEAHKKRMEERLKKPLPDIQA